MVAVVEIPPRTAKLLEILTKKGMKFYEIFGQIDKLLLKASITFCKIETNSIWNSID
jgi:hypothetical protein